MNTLNANNKNLCLAERLLTHSSGKSSSYKTILKRWSFDKPNRSCVPSGLSNGSNFWIDRIDRTVQGLVEGRKVRAVGIAM